MEFELQQQQLETSTKPCFAFSELGEELRRGRAVAAGASARADAAVAALAVSPVHVEPRLVRKGRYRQMAAAFGLTADEQLTCGCHVHVSISSADEGGAVLDRIGPWLPVLLALSANSRAGSAIPAHRIEMLRLAAWRASRSGLDDDLLRTP